MREKLIELLIATQHLITLSTKADFLVANDVVPVVRCKDCACYEATCPGHGYCYHWDYEQGMSPNQVESDDFCSYGERKDNERKAI